MAEKLGEDRGRRNLAASRKRRKMIEQAARARHVAAAENMWRGSHVLPETS